MNTGFQGQQFVLHICNMASNCPWSWYFGAKCCQIWSTQSHMLAYCYWVLHTSSASVQFCFIYIMTCFLRTALNKFVSQLCIFLFLLKGYFIAECDRSWWKSQVCYTCGWSVTDLGENLKYATRVAEGWQMFEKVSSLLHVWLKGDRSWWKSQVCYTCGWSVTDLGESIKYATHVAGGW